MNEELQEFLEVTDHMYDIINKTRDALLGQVQTAIDKLMQMPRVTEEQMNCVYLIKYTLKELLRDVLLMQKMEYISARSQIKKAARGRS